MNTKEKFLNLNVSQISQSYKGKNRCCRCGCGGTYTSTSFMEKPRSTVNDEAVEKHLKRAKKMIESGKGELECCSNHFNISYGVNSAYTFYTDELKITL